jgi:hypothetical protein
MAPALQRPHSYVGFTKLPQCSHTLVVETIDPSQVLLPLSLRQRLALWGVWLEETLLQDQSVSVPGVRIISGSGSGPRTRHGSSAGQRARGGSG